MWAAWEEFCDQLRAAGRQARALSPTDGGLDAAEGLRYVSRLVRAGLEHTFEAATPEHPRLDPAYPRRVSFAQRNPDQRYLSARVSGRSEYRITGRRGTGGSLSFMSRCSGRNGRPEGLTGFLDAIELECAPDGTFEVVLSERPDDRNRVAMTDATDVLLVRELFSFPEGAEPSIMAIERVGETDPDAPLTCAEVTSALASAAAEARGLLERYGDWSIRCAARPNTFTSNDDLLGPGGVLRVGGSPAIDYHLGYWHLEPDEALIVEVAPPAGAEWGFQVMNHWQENLNLPTCASHLNAATAVAGRDGGVELVVADRNPGHPNWVRAAGHARGVMLFRWLGGSTGPAPATAVVPIEEVPAAGGEHEAGKRGETIAPGYLSTTIG